MIGRKKEYLAAARYAFDDWPDEKIEAYIQRLGHTLSTCHPDNPNRDSAEWWYDAAVTLLAERLNGKT